MQEEVENKTVHFAVRTTVVTAKVLWRALKAYEDHIKRKLSINELSGEKTVKGMQTVKQLIGKGEGVSKMDIGDEGIREFNQAAKKYGVDYAIVKDKSEDPPKYVVFFKAKDADAISMVMKEKAAKLKKNENSMEKPSVLMKLKEFKIKAASFIHRDKEKKKERER